MTRRIFWFALIAVAMLILIGAWASTNFEHVEVEHWEPPGVEARRNPMLAMTRFLEVMGRRVEQNNSASALDQLPKGGVILLDAGRRGEMLPERRQHLLDWVAGGGYLIVAAEAPGVADPLLEYFGVDCGCKAGTDEDEDEGGDELDESTKKKKLPETLTVAVPGGGRELQVDFDYREFATGDREPLWQAAWGKRPPQILHFTHGRGNVTVLPRLGGYFSNHSIGEHDHAEFLWRLVETYAPDRSQPVLLLTRMAHVTLWQWLLATLPAALLAATALLLLWLWSVVPRFGIAAPEAPPARRELREHLAAVGRYVWRVGGFEHWLEIARAAFRERLARSHPALLALPPGEQAQALATLTQRPAGLIAAALHEPVRSPQSFTLALRTLRNLERIL